MNKDEMINRQVESFIRWQEWNKNLTPEQKELQRIYNEAYTKQSKHHDKNRPTNRNACRLHS